MKKIFSVLFLSLFLYSGTISAVEKLTKAPTKGLTVMVIDCGDGNKIAIFSNEGATLEEMDKLALEMIKMCD